MAKTKAMLLKERFKMFAYCPIYSRKTFPSNDWSKEKKNYFKKKSDKYLTY